MLSKRLTGTVFALGVGLALALGITARGGFAAPEAALGVPRMSVGQTEATLSAYADALLGGGPYDTFFAEDVVVTAVGSGQSVTGRAEAKAWIDELHHVAFDAHPEIASAVVGAGQAAVELNFVATRPATSPASPPADARSSSHTWSSTRWPTARLRPYASTACWTASSNSSRRRR